MTNSFQGMPRRTSGEITGGFIKVYTTLKMGVIAYQVGQRAINNGATTEEAIKAGGIAAGAWITFFCYTLCYPLWIGSILIQPVIYLDTIDHPTQAHHPMYMVAVMTFLGLSALILQVAVWLVLYSRVKDLLISKQNLLYRAGHRIRRVLRAPWWALGLLGIFAGAPMYFALNI